MGARIFEISGITTANFSSASELEVEIEQAAGEVACMEILRVMCKHESGSATEYQISIGNTPGFTEYSMEQKYLGSATLVADVFDESDVRAYGNTSVDGKIYVRFTPNIGSDNQFSYSISFRI
jgi:hypothetical protein